MMSSNGKDEVFNPISLFNTVGEELIDLINNHQKSVDEFKEYMNWTKFDSLSKIKKTDLKKIDKWFGSDGIGEYLLNFQKHYSQKQKEAKKSYEEYKRIFSKFRHLINLITPNYNSGIDVLGDFADFLEIEDERQILKGIKEKTALYKVTGNSFDALNLYTWKRRGEELFKELDLLVYNEVCLIEWINVKEWISQIDNIDYFKSLPSIFKSFGIGLIFEPFLTKTVYGLVDWIGGRPLIQISDRDKNLAVCWYTLFHELGHVILHKNHQIFEGNFELSKKNITITEKEANKFASDLLFNGDDLRKFIFSKKSRLDDKAIYSCANRYNVYPMFVSYWLNKAGLSTTESRKFLSKIEF